MCARSSGKVSNFWRAGGTFEFEIKSALANQHFQKLCNGLRLPKWQSQSTTKQFCYKITSFYLNAAYIEIFTKPKWIRCFIRVQKRAILDLFSWQLKVSKSRKQNMMSLILPKNEPIITLRILSWVFGLNPGLHNLLSRFTDL